MSIIVHNATVQSADREFSTASAIAIQHNRIAAIGDMEEVARAVGPDAQRIDLDGATVIPGLIDNHLHMTKEADVWNRADLRGSSSVNEVIDRLKQHAAGLPAGQWVAASPFWHESVTQQRRLPTRSELDAVFSDRPVIVPRGMHRSAVNSVALRLAGISSATPDPRDGTIDRDSEGEPTGLLLASAHRRVLDLLPAPTLADRAHAFREAMARYNRLGLTGLREPGTSPEDGRLLTSLHNHRQLTVRINMQPRANQPLTVEGSVPAGPIIEQLERSHVLTGCGDPWFRVGALKMLIDGALDSAYMRAPYATNPAFRGTFRFELGELDRILACIARLGWSLAMHVSGDAAMDEFLAAVKRLAGRYDVRPLRWTIEHAFFAEPDQCRQMRTLGLTPTIHPALMYDFGDAMVGNWGRDRASRLTPVRDMCAAGLAPGAGSDGPFVNISPFLGMQVLITRETAAAGQFSPEQGIDARTALIMYTRSNAYLTFEQDIKGSLEPGKLADLVVCDRDPLSCPAGDIGRIRVLATMVDGEFVYRGGI